MRYRGGQRGEDRALGAGAAFGPRLARVAMDLGIEGPRIFDLQIALIALDGDADTIWTHEARFVSVPGLAVKDPLAV